VDLFPGAGPGQLRPGGGETLLNKPAPSGKRILVLEGGPFLPCENLPGHIYLSRSCCFRLPCYT
jgi:hypothetical protein